MSPNSTAPVFEHLINHTHSVTHPSNTRSSVIHITCVNLCVLNKKGRKKNKKKDSIGFKMSSSGGFNEVRHKVCACFNKDFSQLFA